MTHALVRLLVPAAAALVLGASAHAGPAVTRLTPPSELFASQQAEPVIARFLPGQRFDLQATLRPDAGRRISAARFFIDGKPVGAAVTLRDCATGCAAGLPPEATIATVRAISLEQAGRHEFSVSATQ